MSGQSDILDQWGLTLRDRTHMKPQPTAKGSTPRAHTWGEYVGGGHSSFPVWEQPTNPYELLPSHSVLSSFKLTWRRAENGMATASLQFIKGGREKEEVRWGKTERNGSAMLRKVDRWEGGPEALAKAAHPKSISTGTSFILDSLPLTCSDYASLNHKTKWQ